MRFESEELMPWIQLRRPREVLPGRSQRDVTIRRCFGVSSAIKASLVDAPRGRQKNRGDHDLGCFDEACFKGESNVCEMITGFRQ